MDARLDDILDWEHAAFAPVNFRMEQAFSFLLGKKHGSDGNVPSPIDDLKTLERIHCAKCGTSEYGICHICQFHEIVNRLMERVK